jgi:hypothetical protein
MVELARLFYGTGPNSEIPLKEFQAAAKKVSEGTKQQPLAWAIKFAQEPVENMTRADIYNAQLETGAFLHPEVALEETASLPFNAGLFFSPDEIAEAKKRFLGLIKSAAEGIGCSFEVTQVSVYVTSAGPRYDISYNGSDPGKHAKAKFEKAMLRLAQLVGQRWGYIGFCDRKRHGCGRYFLKSRTDREFCSKTCLNRSTTYRQRGIKPAA